MDEIDGGLRRTQLRLDRTAHGQFAQELPAPVALRPRAVLLQHLAGPEAGLLRPGVEIRRLVEHGVIVIAQHAPLRLLDDQIEALPGVRTVADHVAQAVNLLDAPLLDIRQDGAQSFDVRMNIAENGKHTLNTE
jgi:hypothetical protein